MRELLDELVAVPSCKGPSTPQLLRIREALAALRMTIYE
jgi:hypothetical protein